MTVLITGGCGFIGSNLAIMLKQQYPKYTVLALDNLKRKGSELNMPRLSEHGVQFTHGDIRNAEDLVFDQPIDFIIDAAAEPSVSAGLGAVPAYVINTNLVGSINTLEVAVRHQAKLIFLSTSRVYPIEYLEKIAYAEGDTRFELLPQQSLPGVSRNGIAENFPLDKARSIYGATKLASEILADEFRVFFNMGCVINRCGVVAGPHQMGKIDQGVIALWVARHYWKKDIAYFGYGGQGKQVRDVLHILDLFDLIDYQLHNFEKVNGQVFNAGGGTFSNVSLKELTGMCNQILGNSVGEVRVAESRRGDIPLYITDNAKVKGCTGWQPKRDAHDIVHDIFNWIRENEKMLKPILDV